jgi:diguanylate cyclase (GGDEF)-like protein
MQIRGFAQPDQENLLALGGLIFEINATPNLAEMQATRRPLIIPDRAHYPGWVSSPGTENLHSWAGAPVMSNEDVIAFVTLAHHQPGFYRPEHADPLAAFTHPAAVAIRNARLYEEVRRNARMTETLRQAAEAITAHLDLGQTIEAVLTELQKVVSFDSAAVLLVEGQRLRPVATRGDPIFRSYLHDSYEFTPEVMWKPQDGLQPLVVDDMQTLPELVNLGISKSVRSWMGIPLALHGRWIGLISICKRVKGFYTEENGRNVQLLAAQAAISIENARLFQQVEHMAVTDSVTQVCNRRRFLELARAEWDRSVRYGHRLCIIMIDLDRFKSINDTYGHLAGDAVLREAARRFTNVLRASDLLARYGGDEFVVLLPETGLAQGREAGERLCETLRNQPFQVEGSAIPVTASLGLAGIEQNCISLNELIEWADQAHYHAKQAGRNQLMTWSES